MRGTFYIFKRYKLGTMIITKEDQSQSSPSSFSMDNSRSLRASSIARSRRRFCRRMLLRTACSSGARYAVGPREAADERARG